MKSVPLTAFARATSGRNAVRKLRGAGRVPTVIYGRKAAAQSLELNQRDLEKLIAHSASENILVDLAIEGDSRPARLALVQDVQHDPLTGKVLHIDFHEVAHDEKVTVMIPVETVGIPIGVKNGGVLEHVLFKLKVRALPADLPLVLEVDVTHLELDKVIHLGEIPVPANVEILGDKNVPVIAVAAPRTEAEEAAAEATAVQPTDVEMIKEKKGEEGAPADAKKGEKAEKGEKTDKGEKAEKAEKPAKAEKK
jgi:large subunit ribosomal protein L25